jgi:hypothetical protein
MLITATLLAATSYLLYGTSIFNTIFAQSEDTSPAGVEKVTITLNSATFTPLTDPTKHQVKVLVDYVAKDTSLINAPVNGVMDVYAPNGSRIKTSSYSNGFNIMDSGTIQFATTFTDPTLQVVRTDIVLTDLNKTDSISNLVTTNVSFTPSSGDIQ